MGKGRNLEKFIKEHSGPITDKFILEIFITHTGKISLNNCRDAWLDRYPEIKEYIHSRFKDLAGMPRIVPETIYRLKEGINETPLCECGKPRVFINSTKGYTRFCSDIHCEFRNGSIKENGKKTKLERYGDKNFNNRERSKETCLERYGVSTPTQVERFKEKSKQTCIEKYGVEYSWQAESVKEKAKKTKFEKYGDENFNNRDQAKETCLEKYGSENYFSSQEAKETIDYNAVAQKGLETRRKKYNGKGINVDKWKQTMIERNRFEEIQERHKELAYELGYDNLNQRPEYRKKMSEVTSNEDYQKRRMETMKRNGTFGKSKREEKLYEMLCEAFGEENVIRQYKDKERYNHFCDFYIKDRDVFIELNGFYKHGPKPYDPNDEECIALVNKWRMKYEENPEKGSYLVAIKAYTEIDVQKREEAKRNNLNYIEIFGKEKDDYMVIEKVKKFALISQ